MSTKYKNDYTKEHYDRVVLVVPKGQKEKIKARANDLGMSMNEYIWNLIGYDINKD